jgi:peptidoglycan/LPS O-acetylase OafA/YrhL
MSHAVVQKLAAELAKRIPETAPALRFSTALLVIVGLVAAAAASYHWIESPGNNFLRQWATRRFARRPQITALKPVDAA